MNGVAKASAPTVMCSICKIPCNRFGKHRNGLQRFRCTACRKTYTEEQKPSLLGEMRVSEEKALLAIQLLVEGTSIRATERITGLHRDTLCRLLEHAGQKCEQIMAKRVRNLEVKDVECDEIWGYVGKKENHKHPEELDNEGLGDAYCFIAVERNTKLVINFSLGKRNQQTTDVFIEGLRDALKPGYRFQITTDGLHSYVSAIQTTLGHRVDFAQMIKIYRSPREGEARYSPGTVESVRIVPVIGHPDQDRICTSIVERQNLTVRMQVRRMTRLTNGFSKKFENHWSALCLHFAYYNFCRLHRSLRVTPAMEAGLTNHPWNLPELLAA